MSKNYRNILKPQFLIRLAQSRTANGLPQTFIKLPEESRSVRFLIDAASHRIPLPVTRAIQYCNDEPSYPQCPRCRMAMEREYMSFCDRCGQKLSWNNFDHVKTLNAPIRK